MVFVYDDPEGKYLSYVMDRTSEDWDIIRRCGLYVEDSHQDKVIIPEGTRAILPNAFLPVRRNVREVYVPDGVVISEQQFVGLHQMVHARLPEELVSIPAGCFSCCRELKYVELPKNLRQIESHAFYACVSLHFQLPETVMKIGNYAFVGCRELHEIDLKHVTHVGAFAFRACPDLLIKNHPVRGRYEPPIR